MPMRPREHDLAVLLCDVPQHGLHAGDVGTVVHVYAGHSAYEVEFIDMMGGTLAVTTVEGSSLRPLREGERPVPHLQSA